MMPDERRWHDERVIAGGENVFADLGFDPAEARVLAMRADLMLRIEMQLRDRGWSQAEAAHHLGITQPRVSRLVRGEWRDFSLDTLLKLALRVGMSATLRVA